jgi:hypothetical protein
MQKHSLLKRASAAALLSASLLGLGAGVAEARPSIGALQGDCQSLPGGRWVTDYVNTASGHRIHIGYTCFYTAIGGTQYKDHLDNVGDFQSSWYRQGGKWMRFE